ncbi:S-adenosyl-L-methionine-dependent methyltransferase [Syncephalastrum racemosum]|uniref:S-adenosyl-L-methionine-dependent methyltransferase n=1 Tax=Syncephalastrum racemosum TaxID=13706 RepID=A0A1X2HBR5_SYNRA|nr:S-adenosyl-L-methionine-dependent methyltransferase [Syncephalastrum racemosum]
MSFVAFFRRFALPRKSKTRQQHVEKRKETDLYSGSSIKNTISKTGTFRSVDSPPSQAATSSSSQSTSQKRTIDGRRYHDDNVPYVLPDDDEDKDRLHQQHWMLKLAYGNNFDAPVEAQLENGAVVLDSGCGPATWTLELANAYPHSTFYGIDVAPQFPETIKPFNCNFQVADLASKLPFPDNTFDFIHQRLLVVALSRAGWNNCISELYRILKPGGWIEFRETDIRVASETGSPSFQFFFEKLRIMIEGRGMVPSMVTELDSHLLKEQGFVSIQSRSIPMPVMDGSILGQLAGDDLISLFEGLAPIMSKLYPEKLGTDEQIADFKRALREEWADLDEDKRYAGRWWDICAQKPLENDTK